MFCVYFEKLYFCVDGVLMGVNVVSDLMYVMRLPPCLCSLSVRMAWKCGICGVLDAEVSVDSCIVMMSGCVVCMRCLSSSTVFLMPFFLCVLFWRYFVCFVYDSVRVWVMGR